MAERKSFMIKDGFADTQLVLANPDHYMDAGKVAALVSCGKNSIAPAEFADFIVQRQWNTAVVNDCKIGFSGTAFNDENAVSTECHGAIDVSEIVDDNGVRVAKLAGWVIPAEGDKSVHERVYVQLAASEGKPKYVEALRTPRDDVNSQLRMPLDNLSGFSALVPLAQGQGSEGVAIVRSRGDVKNICRLRH
jgi:hypothetical protein